MYKIIEVNESGERIEVDSWVGVKAAIYNAQLKADWSGLVYIVRGESEDLVIVYPQDRQNRV